VLVDYLHPLPQKATKKMFFSDKFHPFQRFKILDRVFGLESLILVFNAQIQLWEARSRLMECRTITSLGHQGCKEVFGGQKLFKLCPILLSCV